MASINKCGRCGATSYKSVIQRDDQGVMRPSGEYQCTGCRFVFSTVDEWRADPAQKVELVERATSDFFEHPKG